MVTVKQENIFKVRRIFKARHSPMHWLLGKIIFLILILIWPLPSQAKTIWSIGVKNESNKEFGLANIDPNLNQSIINYRVPDDWQVRGKDEWKIFPANLRPPNAPLNPQEIHIKYNYSKDYKNPLLRIWVRASDPNTQGLVVEKGGEELSDPNCGHTVKSSYTLPLEFPLGYIQKGLCEKNEIVLKNYPRLDTLRILFDYLELDNQDEDEDWSLNYEEYKGDTDQDGIEDRQDPDTASFLINDMKMITLDLLEDDNAMPYFIELKAMDNLSPELPPRQPDDVFFLYGVFKAKIYVPWEKEEFSLNIIYPESQKDLARFYFFTEEGDWQETFLTQIDTNTMSITLEVERVDDREDRKYNEFNEARVITLMGGLAYPRSLGITFEENECFISFLFPIF